MFKIRKFLRFFMKKFKLLTLCGVMSLFGNIEGFGMEAEEKPQITYGYIGKVEEPQIITYHQGHQIISAVRKDLTSIKIENALISDSWQFITDEPDLMVTLRKITGHSNLKISSKDQIEIIFDGCKSYNGTVELLEGVKLVTVTWNDDKSIAAALRMLHNSPKTVQKIYVLNDEHLKKIPKNLKHKAFIKQ